MGEHEVRHLCPLGHGPERDGVGVIVKIFSKNVPATIGAMALVRQASWTSTSAPRESASTSSQTLVSPEMTTAPSGVSTR